ncbi:hypothetical protein TUM20286_29070 [Pseudomonas tohonis]|uniref:Secreted protein n=1 Tax=Pseudomonas tohonis TaxID=2725477 RepID=A0ABQ4W136_9PSED|nr:hypothetical protein TUM20286_29070 [Pseudomonas tohonis]
MGAKGVQLTLGVGARLAHLATLLVERERHLLAVFGSGRRGPDPGTEGDPRSEHQRQQQATEPQEHAQVETQRTRRPVPAAQKNDVHDFPN